MHYCVITARVVFVPAFANDSAKGTDHLTTGNSISTSSPPPAREGALGGCYARGELPKQDLVIHSFSLWSMLPPPARVSHSQVSFGGPALCVPDATLVTLLFES